MIIRIPMRFSGSKDDKILYALFDTGAAFSCIREDLAREIDDLLKLRKPKFFNTAAENNFVKVEYKTSLDFEINDLELCDEFFVIKDLSEEVIIGVSTLQKWKIKLDFEHDSLIIDPKVAKFILKDIKLKKLQSTITQL